MEYDFCFLDLGEDDLDLDENDELRDDETVLLERDESERLDTDLDEDRDDLEA